MRKINKIRIYVEEFKEYDWSRGEREINSRLNIHLCLQLRGGKVLQNGSLINKRGERIDQLKSV
jgi:hypothetical protein